MPQATSAATRKYEFTGETKVLLGITLKRIRALISFGCVVKGEIGGWIEGEKNLSQVSGDAWVYGDAQVYGNAWVSGDAQVSGDARVYGNAWVSGDAQVSGDARVYGNARVYGDARVYGNAWVSGDAQVSGNAWVSGDAQVSGNASFFLLGPLGSRRASLTVHSDAKLGVRFTTGCFSGTEYQFRDAVQSTHGDGEHGRQYRAAADLAVMVVKPASVEVDAERSAA